MLTQTHTNAHLIPSKTQKKHTIATDDEEEYDAEDDGGEELAGLERGARGVGLSPEQRQQLMQQREQQQREQQQPGQQGQNGGPRPPAPLAPREWAGLAGMPEPTRDRVEDALERFAQTAAAAAAQTASSDPTSAPTLTVLVLGTPGAGKSATTNSLLNERVARVSPLQSEAARPVLAARRPPGNSPAVTVAVIDTPSLVASAEFGDDDAGGGVSLAAAGALGNALSGRPIDAVLFVDRLDGPPLGAFELALAKAYTSAFGAGIWDKTTLVLSHGRLNCPPGGFASTDDYAAARAAELRAVLRRAGASAAPSTAPLPALLADNGSRCARNEAEEPVLLDGEAWVPAVWEAIVDSALYSPSSPGGATAVVAPFIPDAAKARKAADPDRRRLWLVPVLLAAHLALRWFLVERVIADDGCRGDREGPFPSAVARAKLQAKREERKRKGSGGGGKSGGGGGGKGAGAGKKSGGGGGGDAAAALQRRKRAAAAAAAAKRKRAAGGA